MNDKTDDKLMAMAAELATDIKPQRDLWPEIEAAIREQEPARTAWTPYFAQAAAVVLLVAGTAAVTWNVAKNDADYVVPPEGVATTLDAEFASFGNYELGQGFQDARSNLLADLDLELDKLSPEARTEVEENLAVIRTAIAEINAALEEEPGNVLLQELLLKSYHEELLVMRKVGGLTQNVMSRNDI
ncbi:MAG: hypothetical protein R3358_02050 [Woeseiaceae bacterium]|nr:hypothetical protein [Woeseiaceae bacterium]